MALPWFRCAVDVCAHPKLGHLESLLGSKDALGIIIRLWCWTAAYAPTGKFPAKQLPALASYVTRDGRDVTRELTESGWIEIKQDAVVVHDWREEQGALVRITEQNRQRQRRFRETHRNALRNAHTVTRVTRQEEKRREEKREDQKPSTAPDGAAAEAVPLKPTVETAKAYIGAFKRRWGASPFKDDKPDRTANGILAKIVQSLGAEEAPLVAEYYLTTRDNLYVHAKHPLELFKRDAPKLRAEWAGAKKSSATEARQQDQTQANLDGWEETRNELVAKRT